MLALTSPQTSSMLTFEFNINTWNYLNNWRTEPDERFQWEFAIKVVFGWKGKGERDCTVLKHNDVFSNYIQLSGKQKNNQYSIQMGIFYFSFLQNVDFIIHTSAVCNNIFRIQDWKYQEKEKSIQNYLTTFEN
jgi:hypothetical protein